MKNRNGLIVTLCCVAFFNAACLADIRTENFESRTQPKDSGLALQQLLAVANGMHTQNTGFESWHKQKSVEVLSTDIWSGFMGKMLNPNPSNPQKMSFGFIPGKDNSVLSYLEDEKPTGQKIGIHEWNTWQQQPGEKWNYNQSDDIKFNLPTMQYFMEMPFRLPMGKAIRDYGGIQKIDNIECHVVYVTWGSYPANSQSDQYMVYINKETNRIYRINFTVRDKFRFATGSVFYNDYKKFGDYYLPTLIRIGSANTSEDSLHTIKISTWNLNGSMKRTDYAPDPGRKPASKN